MYLSWELGTCISYLLLCGHVSASKSKPKSNLMLLEFFFFFFSDKFCLSRLTNIRTEREFMNPILSNISVWSTCLLVQKLVQAPIRCFRCPQIKFSLSTLRIPRRPISEFSQQQLGVARSNRLQSPLGLLGVRLANFATLLACLHYQNSQFDVTPILVKW